MAQIPTDALTGLPGRAAFEAVLRNALQKAEAGPISLAFVDVDRFERLNKEHGHEGGDAILKAVASELSSVTGAEVYRYGGDEFVALFAGLEREQAFLRLEKSRENIAVLGEVQVEGRAVAVSLGISVGVAAYP